MSERQRPPVIRRAVHFLLALAVALVGLATTSGAATANTQATPTVVASPGDVPAGAVEDVPSTYQTANACDTTRSWVHTTPAVSEVSHQEYRFQRDVPATTKTEYRSAVRKYTPGQDATYTHSWQKQIRTAKTKTDRQYQKFVSGKVYKTSGNYYVRDFGLEAWSSVNNWPTSGSFFWESQYDGRAMSGGHGSNSNTYTENGVSVYKHSTYFQYVLNGVTRQIPDGYTAWVNSGSPVKSDTKPGTDSEFVQWIDLGVVVKDAATAGSWGAWTPQLDFSNGWAGAAPSTPPAKTGSGTYPDLTWTQSRTVQDQAGYTEYYVNGQPPSRNMADATWEKSATLAGWTKFDERKVVDSAAVPAKVTYYAWSDNKVCDTPVTPPVPPSDVEVLGEAAGKAVGSLRVSCQGTVRVTMRNGTADRAHYKVKIAQRTHKLSVASGKTRRWVTTAAPRQRAKLFLGDKLLASKRLPRACVAPEVLPDTGLRN